MNIYYIQETSLGIYPVGFFATIVANTELEARNLFESQALKEGIELTDKFGIPISYTLWKLDTTVPKCIIHLNGDY